MTNFSSVSGYLILLAHSKELPRFLTHPVPIFSNQTERMLLRVYPSFQDQIKSHLGHLHVRIRGLPKAHGPVSQVRLHFEPLTPDCTLTTPDRLRMWEDTWKEQNFLSFLNRNSVLFYIVVVPAYIPTSSVKELPFLHTLSSIYRLQTFWWWPFWLVWGDTSMQFWFAFLW